MLFKMRTRRSKEKKETKEAIRVYLYLFIYLSIYLLDAWFLSFSLSSLVLWHAVSVSSSFRNADFDAPVAEIKVGRDDFAP